MSVDLSDYTDVLRREISPPGSTVFAGVGDDVLTGYLSDALWEARLDGFVTGYKADPDGIVTPEDDNAPDITRDLIALLVIYAGIRILRNQILNTNTRFVAKAGPVEYETENSATMLVEMLKQLKSIKDRLLFQEQGYGMTTVQLVDGYTVRQFEPASYAGFVGTLLAEQFGSVLLDSYTPSGDYGGYVI